tara:strand:- start:1394 stop:2059 length:666 start_codon:yes stop_codon:yes gene_type:complete
MNQSFEPEPELESGAELESISEKEILLNDIEIEESEIESLEEKMFRDIIKSVHNIKRKCERYKKAHTYCQNFNFKADRIVKIMMLGLSTLTTYFINSHTDELTADELVIDRNLTFATTIITGINAIFNFSNRSESHKAINTEYIRVKNDIKLKLKTFDYNIGDGPRKNQQIKQKREEMNSIYEKSLTDITNLIIRSNELGILGRAKRISGLTDKDLDHHDD